MNLWQGFDEFLALAGRGSFTAAARETGHSVAHISRQLRQLEDRLGVRLVNRTTRRVQLTDSGRWLAERLATTRRTVQDAIEQVQGEQRRPTGRIRLSCAVGFASRRLTRSLAEFARSYPDVELDIDYSTRQVDLIEEGFDLAVRFGKLSDSNIVARRLSERPMRLVASPEYLADHGRPQTPEELSDHRCLVALNNQWTFRRNGRSLRVPVSGTWRCNNADALINASVAGLGIAYLAYDLVESFVREGTLVSLLEAHCITDNATWILYPRRDYLPQRVRLLIDHLVADAAAGDDSA
ncbi:MAG: LysR family transcriptional regulator [Pseudomonadota bacterium]